VDAQIQPRGETQNQTSTARARGRRRPGDPEDLSDLNDIMARSKWLQMEGIERLGWSIRKSERETGVRRETIGETDGRGGHQAASSRPAKHSQALEPRPGVAPSPDALCRALPDPLSPETG
jgi:hypothetical protein